MKDKNNIWTFRAALSKRLLIRAAASALAGLGGITRYLEIPGGHNIIDKNEAGWDRLGQALIEFGRSVERVERKCA